MQYSKNDILSMAGEEFFGEGNAQLPSDKMLMGGWHPHSFHHGWGLWQRVFGSRVYDPS